MRRWLACSLLLVACGENQSVIGALADAAADRAAPDAAVTDTPDAPVMDTPDAPVMDAPDVTDAPARCAPGACPAGRYCDDVTGRCEPGCGGDGDCAATVADGGASQAGRCDPVARRCVACVVDAHCPPGFLCVGNLCAAGCSSGQACPGGQACCGGACVDTAASTAHCGACGAACAVPNATPSCLNGTCGVGACAAGFADCDGDPANGCEADTRASLAHCGACGRACEARANTRATCEAGACRYACEAGFADCDNDPANGCEVDTRSSLAHCGACGRTCAPPNATAACAMGVCAVSACAGAFADCNGNVADGCEVDTATAVSHCGACGRACPARPNAFPGCLGGACVASCVAGFQDCDAVEGNGCEVDTRATLAHCGGCGRACATRAHATARCELSTCAWRCDAGFGDCDGDPVNGCEADLRADPARCGACDNRCASGVCAGGVCAAPSCTDGVRNGGERDVDCGGTCPRCALGRACVGDSDCAAGACLGGLCLDLACTNGPTLGPASGFTGVRVRATSGLFRGVGSIVGDGAGTLYAQDPYGNGNSGDRVLRIDRFGTVTDFAAPSGLSTCTSQQIGWHPTLGVLLWDITSNTLLRFNGAGQAAAFSTVEGIGGGGSCSDSGVQGVFGRDDGVVVTSPARAQLIYLRADGTVARRISGLSTSFRIAPDGAGLGVLATTQGGIARFDGAGARSTVFQQGGITPSALRRDGDGDIHFLAGSSVLAVRPDGSGLRLVVACVPQNPTDLTFDQASAGVGTSLYLSTLGATFSASDGDGILEVVR